MKEQSEAEASVERFLLKLSAMVEPIVQDIEQSVPITQNHYDDYLLAITTIANGLEKSPPSKVRVAVAIALLRAGANKEGIRSALMVLGDWP